MDPDGRGNEAELEGVKEGKNYHQGILCEERTSIFNKRKNRLRVWNRAVCVLAGFVCQLDIT